VHQFYSKCCAFALVVSLLDFGCTHRVIKKVDPALINADREEIVGVTTNRGEEVRFDSPGGALRNGVISARVRGSDYMISIPDVTRLWVARVETSVARTVGLVVGIAAGTLATVVAYRTSHEAIVSVCLFLGRREVLVRRRTLRWRHSPGARA